MVIQDGATPEEGELVVATIKTVKQNGAYVDLDEYEGIEGFIFIGEIASGWVKNIRGFVRRSASHLQSVANPTGQHLTRTLAEVCFRRTSSRPSPSGRTNSVLNNSSRCSAKKSVGPRIRSPNRPANSWMPLEHSTRLLKKRPCKKAPWTMPGSRRMEGTVH